MEKLEILEKYIDSTEGTELKELVREWLNSVKI